jgi:hypothetical protein
VFVLGAGAAAGVAWVLDNTDVGNEVVLPILLVYGVLTLLVALAALVAILSYFGLSSGASALGSQRAASCGRIGCEDGQHRTLWRIAGDGD